MNFQLIILTLNQLLNKIKVISIFHLSIIESSNHRMSVRELFERNLND